MDLQPFLASGIGVNHLVMSTEWAGMPESLAVETIEMIATELFPRVQQGI